jgi:hypothetical protein
MKIIIDGDSEHNDLKIYRSKAEYDADCESWVGWQKTWKEGTYQLRHRREPSMFPCIMINAGIIYEPNGPDEIDNAFIYDFIIEE